MPSANHPIDAPLALREDPEQQQQQRDLTTRSFPMRAESVDEATRSVEAILATENPVEVFDWSRWEVIEEVLRMDGVELPEQIPLLANHDRWSLESVYGSSRELAVSGAELRGRLFFAEGGDANSPEERAWQKVKQRHLRDVSVGYRVLESTDIMPGQTAVVKGRSYTAGKRTLRISTRWTPKEVSLVPIGADKRSKIRSNNPVQENGPMPPKLRAFLVTHGLRADATDQQAQEYYNNLSPDDKARADAAANAAGPPPNNGGQRSEPPASPPAGGGNVDQEALRQQGIQAERERVREIYALAGEDVPPAMRQQAIDEGWDVTRASREFLTAIRGGRGPAGEGSRGPAIHSHSREADVHARSLAAGLLIGQGLDPTRCRSHDGRAVGPAFTPQEADLGHRLSRLSAVDLARECARIDTGRNILDYEEAIRAAVSGGTLVHVFTTNAYARLVQGWEKKVDTTVGWCDEEDAPNFLEQEDISLTANAGMKKLPRGGTAKDATLSDRHEKYKIARFADKFVVDEQDFIDDRLGAIMRMPEEMGEQAREVRPNLVYSLIISNPALVADGKPVFHTDHGNTGTGVLSSANLKAAISAMGKQREAGRVLNISAQYLIVPAALEWTAEELLSPAMIAKLFANVADPQYSVENLIARRGLKLVVDDRLGANGVINPNNGNKILPGSDTQWLLAAGGSKSIRVAYLRGRNRMPQMRSFTLDKGQWGIGWDINFDIGAAFMDYRPWYHSTGAVSP